MIVSKRDPLGVTPFEVRGLPGIFPCPLEDWLATTGLTEDALEAYADAIEVVDEGGAEEDAAPAGAHTATTTAATDISAAVTRKED